MESQQTNAQFEALDMDEAIDAELSGLFSQSVEQRLAGPVEQEQPAGDQGFPNLGFCSLLI